ncbi:MAG: DUF3429 domain-containing protein, partial [Pseudomonadota bacterium]|nr:DUF3429 domain-containing protein [Pseudomonadota bacterium]
ETIGYISKLFYAYSAVIISFIAGTHWGICLHSKDGNKRTLLESNLITLVAWFSLFYLGLITELILIGCFLYLLHVEHRLKRNGIVGTVYFSQRLQATFAVILIQILFYINRNFIFI